jgi:hypothetical protein
MAVAKQERQKLEQQVHSLRHEGGTRAVYELLRLEQDELNKKWPDLRGDDLIYAQGAAKSVARLLAVIEHGPTIKVITQRSE